MKAGVCTVCASPARGEIDAAHVSGTSSREIARRFGRNKDTITKHVREHIPAAAQKAVETAREIDAGDSILAEIERLKKEATRLQAKAEKKDDIRAALTAIDRLTRLVELHARLLGELRDRDINVTNVQLDADTAMRMAQMFVARRQPRALAAALVGDHQPPVSPQTIENERTK